MRKLLSFCFSLLLCFSLPATALASNFPDTKYANQIEAIPYTVPSAAVTEEMRSLRYAVLEKYPGLEVIDPANIDSSLPIITVNSMNELTHLMAGVSSSPLYEKGYDVSALVNSYLDSLGHISEEPVYAPAVTSSYGDAPAYHQENSESINCYGYAADFNWFIQPGDIYYTDGSQFTYGSTVEEVAGWVEDDFWRADQRPIREISSATASISSTERRIAVRVGSGYMNVGGSIYPFTDFHFMRQTNTGRWGHKPGRLPSMYTTITNPSASAWDMYGETSSGDIVVAAAGFYNSDVIYHAI